jgi:acyl-homoserine-lactone acylase
MRATPAVLAVVIAIVQAACGGGRVEEPAPAEQPDAPVEPPQPAVEPTGRVEILWDTWGIPHIHAQDETALLWAFGWAQAASHGDLLLRLYGQARGRAAEYWGEDWLDSDVWIHTNGVPARAAEWLDAQSPYMRAYIDAFAEGINAYARTHPDSIDDAMEAVLPITATDVLAHAQRITHLTFVLGAAGIDGAVGAWQRASPNGAEGSAPDDAAPERDTPGYSDPAGNIPADNAAAHNASAALISADENERALRPSLGPVADALLEARADAPVAGSNGWAIAPSRSASGNALLLINPHLPWGDLYTWYEAQLVLPGMDVYGAALVGMPLPGIAFNRDVGWTHTVNTIDAADLYEVELNGTGYVWDGGTRPLEASRVDLRVRLADGTARTETITVTRTVHGPLIARRGNRALALRIAGLDAAGGLDQLWGMLRASNMGQFEAVLGNLQLPMFTVLYADREGHILHVFNGRVPVRETGDWRTWSGIVPGESPALLWTGVHAYNDLPRVADPATGWLQNANDPPWTTTFPSPLDPDAYPPYMAPQSPLSFRPQRSARMLAEDTSITFAEVVAYKHSTHVESADHILEDLVIAVRTHGGERARRAAQVLEAWDRMTNADSRGAVLWFAFFDRFARRRWQGGSPFDVPWLERAPFSTPDGLSDAEGAAQVLDAAAEAVESEFGSLDVAWGDVHRLRRDSLDFAASGAPGGPGVFRVLGFADAGNGRRVATSGDSFVAVVEFGDQVRAVALLGYGNASKPGSPHRTDQLGLLARSQLRPVWLSIGEVEANLERRERF